MLMLMVAVLCWSVWQSAAQTTGTNAPGVAVTNKPAGGALERYFAQESDVTPGWVEQLARDFPFLKARVLGNELWKYLASLIYIFLAFYFSKLLDHLTRVWLKKWTAKTGTQFDDLVLDLLNGPVKVVAFVVFLHIGLGVFRWPAKAQVILAKGFTVIVAFTLTYMALKFTDLLLGYWRQRAIAETDRAFNDQLFPIVRKSLKAFVIVVAVLVTAQNLDINVTAALASLSIGGLAVGLAAQDTLANLFGAVAVFADQPFRIGDRIQMDTVDGTVESIGIRSTRVRSTKGYLVAIPNKTVGNATIVNLSRRSDLHTEMNLALAADTPVDKLQRAVAILYEIQRANRMVENVTIAFNRFADSSLNIVVHHTWLGLDQAKYLAGMQELNLAIKQRFDAEGIKFNFPAQTTYLK
jgi:MscS family membrane protein